MASRIPQSFIDEVRSKVNIVDVIGQYTPLAKKGRQWNGSCPFHEDKHPSLFVEENKQVFNCFSCGRSGSVFSFIMEKEGLSYPEAILFLAESVDMPIDSSISATATHPVDATTQAIYQLHNDAQRLYQHTLLNTTSGEAALQYLHDKRHLTDDIIKTFGIGFVPDDNLLLSYAQNQNLAPALLSASELFLTNSSGEQRDRFAGRIVWPIKTERGQVVGFSGRALDKDNSIKYMNSPESPFFTKGRILYNFDRAKNIIRQTGTAMIFEGFMDVISADMADQKVGVATMGTALTSDHVHQLAKVAKRILLVYDGDDAGQTAARRSIELITNNAKSLEIGVVHLPDNLDPDEVRIKLGLPQLAQSLTQNIQTPIEFLVDDAKRDKNLSNQAQYLQFLKEVMIILNRATPVEQDLQLTRISKEFGTSKEALQAQLTQTLQQKSNQPQAQSQRLTTRDDFYGEPPQDNYYDQLYEANPQFKNTVSKVELAERALIMAMIKDPQVMRRVKSTAGFTFVHSDYQLLMMLAEVYQRDHIGSFDIAKFMDFLQKPELNQKIMAIDRLFGDLEVKDEAVSDYLRLIINDAPQMSRIDELQRQINVAKQQHDDTKLVQLTTELINIKKQQQ
ncbi:MAG: DNA primase [Leuconostoc pseudomesenteroides]|uniref:DNA primase n=1 Tax=Leuconostoc pseudomesenteroides TaxID=33968 RepID=UPI0039EAA7AB